MGIEDDKPVIETRSYKVGGDNVVELFPNSTPKADHESDTVEELKRLQKMLRYHNSLIKEAMAQLAAYQLQCAKTEDDYDDLLKIHADRVGAGNVSINLMNYGSHVKPIMTPNGIELVVE